MGGDQKSRRNFPFWVTGHYARVAVMARKLLSSVATRADRAAHGMKMVLMPHSDPVNDNFPPRPGDRRAEPRRRVLLSGKIVYPHMGVSADCTIRDLSVRGARIAVHPEAITAEPYLIVVRDAVVHRSHTVWRTLQQTGLRLLASTDLTGETPLGLKAIQRLWLELAPR